MVFLWLGGSMDVDGIIDSELHEEGLKMAAWEKAYNAALDRWDYELTDEERAKHIEDWITNNDGVPAIAKALAFDGDKWRERLCLVAEDIETQAANAWATEQARKELEDVR